MKKTCEVRQVIKWIAIIMVFILFLLGAITVIQAINGGMFNYENRVAYTTDSWETQDTIEIKHIAREKGKEAIYTIYTFWGGETEIPESTFQQYIGEGNNTVTIRNEELTIYVATKWFGLSFDESEQRGLIRTAYPWDDAPQEFTDEEIEEVIRAIEDTVDLAELWTNKTYSQWEEKNFSFQFDRRSWGRYSKNCLEKGAIKYRNTEITWWWEILY